MDTAVLSMLSYIRLLPYELLREIFLYYLEAAAHLYPTPKLLPPLLLGQICSTWRHVVHSTPKLWTRFSLDIRNKVKEGRVDHVSFAKAWLSRAHPYPLDISLSVRTKALNHIVDAILPCADRLRVIDLRLPFPHFQPLVDAGSMALLESVNLSVTSDCGREPTFWVRRITAFTTAPRLRSVTISSSHRWALLRSRRGRLFGSGIQMPWSQLTELHIDESCESADTFRDAFLQCTNLVNCTLFMCTWEGGTVIPDVPTVVLSHLRKLEVTFSGTGHSFPFFQPLNLPALKDLTVATTNWCVWSHQIFMGFTLRSSLDLERLSFKQVEIRSHELLEFLGHMHSLVELEIEFPRCIGRVFDALCYREMDSQHLIPKLEILRFFEAWHNPIDDDCVANAIESRWWTDDAPRMVSRLKRVDIVYDSEGINSRVWERLEHCRQEGLVLNLHWVQDSP
jgi:hypothetical protein